MSYTETAKKIAKRLYEIRTLEEWDPKREHAIEMIIEYHDEHLTESFNQMKQDELGWWYQNYANSHRYEEDRALYVSENVYMLYNIEYL